MPIHQTNDPHTCGYHNGDGKICGKPAVAGSPKHGVCAEHFEVLRKEQHVPGDDS